MPQAYWIIPLEAGHIDNTLPPGYGGRPSQGLPGYGHPANRPPGSWGGPVDPGFGSGGVDHVGGGPIYHPGHPEHGLPSAPAYPTGGPIVPPQGGTDVPEDVYTPAPVPEEIASQYVVTVYDPKTMTYTTKTYPPR